MTAGGTLSVVGVTKFQTGSEGYSIINPLTTANANGEFGSSSANATNYAARSENASNGVAVTNCTNVSSALLGGNLPKGYTITSGAVKAGDAVTCTLRGPNSTTATFTATGIN